MTRVKYISFLMILAILGWTLGGYVPAEAADGAMKIIINGSEVLSDTSPVIINNRTLVPIRIISESLGMDVKWDGMNKWVVITSKDGSSLNQIPTTGVATQTAAVRIFINGSEVPSDTSPIIINNRTMVPIRVITERLGMIVDWLGDRVVVTDQPLVSILGNSVATSAQLRALLKKNNPSAPDLVDLYLNIGREYGIRGDIAFCQAAKETGWWKFGGLVIPEQNNYCGLGATGALYTGEEDLNGADPSRVSYRKGGTAPYFDSPATGVEAQMQHLYAYACNKPLPVGKTLLDPRFKYVTRGVAPNWVDLSGKWARPGYDINKYNSLTDALANGDTYGYSIIRDYYLKAVQAI